MSVEAEMREPEPRGCAREAARRKTCQPLATREGTLMMFSDPWGWVWTGMAVASEGSRGSHDGWPSWGVDRALMLATS